MNKIIMIAVALILLCVSGAYCGGSSIGKWNLVETDPMTDSAILEHKKTGEQKIVYEGEKLGNSKIDEIKKDSIRVSAKAVIRGSKTRIASEIWVGGGPGLGVSQPESQ